MRGAARITGARLWLGTATLFAAVLVGSRTLGTVVRPGPWLTTAAVGLALLAVVVGVLRQVLRSRLAPTAWGLLGVVVGIAGQYGGLTTGFSVPRPTQETLERLRLLVGQGQQTILEGRVPVQPTRGLEMLLLVLVLVTYLVAELVALGMGRGGLAGLAILGLWSPAVSFETDVALLHLLAGGATFVLLLAVTRRRSRRHDLPVHREVPTAALAAGVVTVAALVVGTAAGALPFAGSVRLPSSWGAQDIDSPLRLSTDLDMRNDLDGRSDRPLLEYTGDVRAVGALRMYTVTQFDGQEWHRGSQSSGLVNAEGLLWPTAVEPAEEPARVRVRVLALDGDRLPVPGEPREIAADGRWLYDAARDEVVGANTSTRGLEYELTISPRGLTADGLREDTAGRPGGLPSAYLDVPSTEHETDIRRLAQEITADATTTYDQALAIQQYLRSAQNFAYDTRLAEPRTTDAVWDFLTSGRGYCVQFATAMTLMARMVGIPARMAVGFLPGVPDEGNTSRFVVSARQAHTWPELYFADAGWVRFEPTPARQTGAPPLYADPFAGQPQQNENIPTGTAAPSVVPSRQPGAGERPTRGVVTIGETEVPVAAVAGVGGFVALVLLGVAALVWRRHRLRLRRPDGPEEWWARLRATLAEHGVSWTDATTPRQAAHLVRRRLDAVVAGNGGTPEVADARAALDALVAAVETERYAPRPVTATDEELGAWVDAVERPLAAVGAAVEED
ncbi:MAG: DUF4129 domain-containing protein [Actinomycetales bacterium]|nr:DUF4129 domain-containing protein [Actinomycetales bacterium]